MEIRTARAGGAWLALGAILAACGPATTNGPDAQADGATDASATDAGAMDAGAMDTGAAPDAASDVHDPYDDPDARSPATAIEAPADQWTWVPFGDALCADGSPTGIGVNLHPGAHHALIFMQGGGACWEPLTCFALMTASHITGGYGEADFRGEIAGVSGTLLFNRDEPRNPFRDASFVYIPYCTGDVHMGERVTTLTYNRVNHDMFFVGARNVAVYLRRLVPTFAGFDRVWLSGSSAGGFGAMGNFDRVQTAFGAATRVDLIDDSGPPMVPAGTRWDQWNAAWNIQFPPGCTECRTDFGAALDFYTRTYGSSHRVALLSSMQDATISTYMGYSGAEFQTRIEALSTQYAGQPGMGFFYVNGTTHTMLGNVTDFHTSSGTQLLDWLTQMVTDDPAWQSAGP